MGWKISKDFYGDYGHRVWTQELEEAFCAKGDTSCKCKHLHGHTGKVTVEVSAGKLDKGFVTDFKHLGFIKDFVDEYIDHRFIIDKNDPMYKTMTKSFDKTHKLIGVEYGVERFMTINPKYVKVKVKPHFLEYIDSFTVVDFVPTSENLAEWIFGFASKKFEQAPFKGVNVTSVTWQETPKSKAVYSA